MRLVSRARTTGLCAFVCAKRVAQGRVLRGDVPHRQRAVARERPPPG